jgi:hypothetical protein
MIESFASDETERLFATGKSRRLPPQILKRAVMRLAQLHAAFEVDDLRIWLANGASVSMTVGVCAFGLRMDMRMTLKLWTTTEE